MSKAEGLKETASGLEIPGISTNVTEDGKDRISAVPATSEHDNVLVKGVIDGVRQSFIDEGVDLEILTKLEALWISKLTAAAAAQNEKSKSSGAAVSGTKSPGSKRREKPVKAKRMLKKKERAISDEEDKMEAAQDKKKKTKVFRANRTIKRNKEIPKEAQETATLVEGMESPVLTGENIVLKESYVNIEKLNLPSTVKKPSRLRRKKPKIQFSVDSSIIQGLSGNKFPVVRLEKLQIKAMEKLGAFGKFIQVDGGDDTSDEDDGDDNEEEDDDDDDDDDDDIDPDGEEDDEGAEEEPLGSEDDISDEDAIELFDTENVVVCQYDKISRTRNKWKFNLKDGIMNLNGRDYVFSRALGEAEW